MHVGYEKWYALSGYANLSTYWFFSLLVLSYFLWQKLVNIGLSVVYQLIVHLLNTLECSKSLTLVFTSVT